MRQSRLRQVRRRRLPPEGGAAGAERQYAAYGAARHSSGRSPGGRCKLSGQLRPTLTIAFPENTSRCRPVADPDQTLREQVWPRGRCGSIAQRPPFGCRSGVPLRRWAAAASAQKKKGERRRARALKIGCCRTWCSRQSSPTRGRPKSSSSSRRRSSRARTSSFTWRDRMLAPAAVAPWPRDRELQPGPPPARSVPGCRLALLLRPWPQAEASVVGHRACWPGPARVTRGRACGRCSVHQIGRVVAAGWCLKPRMVRSLLG